MNVSAALQLSACLSLAGTTSQKDPEGWGPTDKLPGVLETADLRGLLSGE